MTVGELKSVIAGYLQKSPSFFAINSVDLLLLALNNARKNAELLHDFNSNTVVAEVTISPSVGGLLSSAVLRGTATAVNLKEYVTFYRVTDNGDIPLYHHGKKTVAVWTKERIRNARGRFLASDIRYPDDASLRIVRDGPEEVYLHGDQIQVTPTIDTAFQMAIDGIAWMPEYTGDTDRDWMTTYGHEYLMWAACCELNYLTLTWTPNLDGNLGPPIRMKEQALERLVNWDAMQVEQGRQPRGIR